MGLELLGIFVRLFEGFRDARSIRARETSQTAFLILMAGEVPCDLAKQYKLLMSSIAWGKEKNSPKFMENLGLRKGAFHLVVLLTLRIYLITFGDGSRNHEDSNTHRRLGWARSQVRSF